MKLPNILLFLFALFAPAVAVHANQPAPNRDQVQFERVFLVGMIDHHFGGIKMAELCKGRTIHPELQEMCESVMAAQAKEIAEMKAWLKNWYGVTHEPRVPNMTKKQIEMLKKMTGAAFEKAFMTMLTEHHAMAVMQSSTSMVESYHMDLINMNAMTITMQADEMLQLRVWLRTWYSITDLD